MRGRPLGILHGVPTSIKDLAFTRGVRTMAGSHIHRDRIPDFDHLHVERLRAAGAISIGKTTVSEFGWSGVSKSPLTGITHNPWKHGMNAGASSAGAAVCAAAGIGPIHQGSDGAGSVRMPAAFCGIYGIKPSHGRVPYWPTPANGLISHVGPLTRTVADAGADVAGDGGSRRSRHGQPRSPAGRFRRASRRRHRRPEGRLQSGPRIPEGGCGSGRTGRAKRWRHSRNSAAKSRRSSRAGTIRSKWSTCISRPTSPAVSVLCSKNGQDRMDPGLVALVKHGMKFSAARILPARREATRAVRQGACAFRALRSVADADIVGRCISRRSPDSVALGTASVGLDALGRLQLSVQSHLAAGSHMSLRLYVRRIAGRTADRGGPASRSAGAAGIPCL